MLYWEEGATFMTLDKKRQAELEADINTDCQLCYFKYFKILYFANLGKNFKNFINVIYLKQVYKLIKKDLK